MDEEGKKKGKVSPRPSAKTEKKSENYDTASIHSGSQIHTLSKFQLREKETKGFKKKKPLRFMQTRDISFYFARETYIKSFINEMLIFISFLITIILITQTKGSSVQYYYTKVITGLFINTQFTMGTGNHLVFTQIRQLDAIWPYIEGVLLQNLYWKYWYFSNNTKAELSTDDANILYESKLVGLPRMRQVRVKNDSCTILEDYVDMFSQCFAEYSVEAEDKEPFSFKNSTAWIYSDASSLGSTVYKGRLSNYEGGGFYMDFNLTKDISNYTLHILKSNQWIDRGTRLIIIDFILYNANINFFGFVRIAFELLPSGGVLPSYEVEVLQFSVQNTIFDYIMLVFQTIFIGFVAFYLFEELYEIYYFHCAYFKSLWNWLDLTLLTLGCISLASYSYLYIFTKTGLEEKVKDEDVHVSFDKQIYVMKVYRNSLYILLLLAFVKLLKYLSLSQSMEQMQMTLARATKDILNYSFLFFIVFIAFGQLGHLLFGRKVKDFRTLVKSCFALLRTIVGDFDYTALELAEGVLGPIYFFSYIFMIFFIMVPMFLAIIIDTYSQVRDEMSASGAQLQVSDVVGRCFTSILRNLGFKKIADSRQLKAEEKFAKGVFLDIRNLLHKCGYTELEINLFFAKYNITEDTLVSPQQIQKLLDNLKKMPVSEMPEIRPVEDMDTISDELTKRVEVMEDSVLNLNNKIDLIVKKVNVMQEVALGKRRTI